DEGLQQACRAVHFPISNNSFAHRIRLFRGFGLGPEIPWVFGAGFIQNQSYYSLVFHPYCQGAKRKPAKAKEKQRKPH
ncbi:MAG: hypothetical protein OEW12_05660, partial [Deltaproteobacteria bacterium]|nr:hypothetical protein [Deltaproteobacteria bacterium]